MHMEGKTIRAVGTQGFTLIELLFTVAILAVIAALAVPTFTQTVNSIRNKESGRQLFASINYARTLAVTKQQYVSVCATINGIACNGAGDFSNGGLVFVDNNHNGLLEADEELLQMVPSAPENSLLKLNGLKRYLHYKPDGRLTSTGNFSFCPGDKNEKSGWIIVFYWSGRPYFGRDSDGDGIVENGSGGELAC